MKYGRVYNFSSGPAMMPEPVLEDIRNEFMNYADTGMCVMEMSHRSEEYNAIARRTEADLRELMSIPNHYRVLFMQGGGTLQFSAVPANLMKNRRAVYIESGVWSKKAAAEAERYGDVSIGASGGHCNYCSIPDCTDLDIAADTDYVYICENETVNGVMWPVLPNVKGHVLVSDQSSMFLSKPCDVSSYGVIIAGVQKNLGPSGMAVVIIREDLIREDLDPTVPLYLRYSIHSDFRSGYNTPNTWSMYCCGKTLRYLKDLGGLGEIHRRNAEKAAILYNFLDASSLFRNPVEKACRSFMNIPFGTGDAQLDAQVVTLGKKHGLHSLSGHPSVGGLRASLYNAMPREGVEALVSFLRNFECGFRT